MLILIRILFFLLIPTGIFLLVKAVKLLTKSFNGKIITEIPFTVKTAGFTIIKPGKYSIWHKGKLFQRTLANQYRPEILNNDTNTIIPLSHSIMRPNANNGTTGRMELFTFSAEPGNYTLSLKEGSSISGLENMLSSLIPGKTIDPDKYYIQIRESQLAYLVIIGILLCILSAGCIIGGLVAGLVAEQIFLQH